MKLGKRTVSILTIICIMMTMLSGFGTISFAAEFGVDKLVEAEAGTLANTMKKVQDANASGGYCITVEDGARVDEPAKIAKPDAYYEFNITTAGKYGIWVKTLMESQSSDSFYWKIDDKDFAQKGGAVSTAYTWLKITDADLTAGKHSLSIVHRENGAKLDVFSITTDPNKSPDGAAAPAQSSTPTPSAAPSTQPSTGSGTTAAKSYNIPKDGTVIIEAEDTTIAKDLASVVTAADANGGKGVEFTITAKDQVEAALPGAISLNVTAEKAGAYQVWVRYAAASGGNDSCYSSVGDAKYADKSLPVTNSKDTFLWTALDSLKLVAGQPATYRMRPRESGAIIDTLLITNVLGFTPTGKGSLPEPGSSTVAPLPSGKYPMPTITPPAQHPRVLFTAKDIPTIKANMEKPQNAASKTQLEKFLAQTTDGVLAPPKDANSSSYSSSVLAIVESKAFDYAINGNEASGKEAVSAIKNVLETSVFASVQDITRSMGHTIFVASEVYDWCYPLLTSEDKTQIVLLCQSIASQMETGWPPSKQGPVTGHAGEAQIQRDLLSFAIATYNEYPDIYNYIAGRYLSEFLLGRNFWYQSESYHQGTSYSAVRYAFDMWAQWIFYRMSGEKIFVPEGQYPMYMLLYYRRPDGMMIREGDYTTEKLAPVPEYFKFSQPAWLASNFYGDPYLKKELAREDPGYASFTYTFSTLTPVQFLLINDPNLEPRALSELPKTKYFGSPNGMMVARTGWNDGIEAPDTIAFMKIGEQWAANHMHLDSGTFQIYYKGILANDAGIYDAYGTSIDNNFSKETISHNGLLIYDSNEKINGAAVNSGGQRRPGSEVNSFDDWMKNGYDTGKVIGHEFGPDPVNPEYSYISGDITRAYSDKVSEVRRSMLFMPTENEEAPAAFIVMDKIVSKDASFKKTFLLQSLQEPEVNGNVTIMKRNTDGYNGQLTIQTLYPKNANIEKIGGPGKQWFINGTNYIPGRGFDQDKVNSNLDYGWGRVEISPSTPQKEDYFLNVMYVSDADKNIALNKAELIETDAVLGAKILDRVSVFAKDKTRLAADITFTIPGEGTNKVALSGIQAGEWSIRAGGSVVDQQIATEDGGIIYFTAPAGEVSLSLTNPAAVRTPVTVVLSKDEGVSIKFDGSYMYSDVPATIIEGRTLVPMRAIFEKLGATVTWDDATSTATAVKVDQEIKITEDSKTVYVNGEAKELDVPATIINGRFVVPVRFVSEALGAAVGWDEMSQTVSITPGKVSKPKNPDAIQIVGAKWSTDNGEDQNGYKAYDQNPDTRWAAEGVNEWIIFEFKEVSTVASFYTQFLSGSQRVYSFDLLASADGENYTQIFSGKTDGKGDEQTYQLSQPVQAKYIKFVGKANTVNQWNSLHEIEFRTK